MLQAACRGRGAWPGRTRRPASAGGDPAEAMLLLLLLAALGGPAGAASPPVPDGPSGLPAPRDVARGAVDAYNQQDAGSPAAFRLLKIRSAQRTRFDWGVHFSLNFTIKETTCRKTSSYRIGSCKYKPSGRIRDCSAEVSVLSLVDDAPLTSVQCNPVQRGSSPGSRNAKPNSRPQAAGMASPSVHVEHYFPSSYSTAALMAVEGE
ncbi:cathelicidin-2-like [Tiliqua scincoides]|uniref:cathelicidin-2-like n=1 Tax=Tiliqua scincoides TaxID=71010 RepID=UPI0034630412